ncbi:unnamed protein product [Nezara viridula]|uniref:Uncharacterized protein n=1 Tax=Nezara viridula TaxID=85310 RepID=A0A9P0HUS2_NEZVI|nr:unnamed protein product [Nezara viridula]
MSNRRPNSNPEKAQCRRDFILKQLLLLVSEIEEHDKPRIDGKHHYDHAMHSDHHGMQQEHHDMQHDHHDMQHDDQGMQHDQHPVQPDDPSCCVGIDLLKDEYYQPMTVDGQPARPVLTRKAAAGKHTKWCPPCYKVVPAMDYTLSCYRPPWSKDQQEAPYEQHHDPYRKEHHQESPFKKHHQEDPCKDYHSEPMYKEHHHDPYRKEHHQESPFKKHHQEDPCKDYHPEPMYKEHHHDPYRKEHHQEPPFKKHHQEDPCKDYHSEPMYKEHHHDPYRKEHHQEPHFNKHHHEDPCKDYHPEPMYYEHHHDPYRKEHHQESPFKKHHQEDPCKDYYPEPMYKEHHHDPYRKEHHQESPFKKHHHEDPCKDYHPEPMYKEHHHDPYRKEHHQEPPFKKHHQEDPCEDYHPEPMYKEHHHDPDRKEHHQEPPFKKHHQEDPCKDYQQEPMHNENHHDPYRKEQHQESPFKKHHQEADRHQLGNENHIHHHEYYNDKNLVKQNDFGSQANHCKCDVNQPENQIKSHVESKRHHMENVEAAPGIYKCVYDPLKASSRRVICNEENKIHPERQSQPYTGIPGIRQEHVWEGGDGHKEVERHHPGDKHHEQKRNECQQRPEENYHQYGKGHKHGHASNVAKHHSDPIPKAVVLMKPKEESRHHGDETKYYPVLIPKDVVWPEHKEHHIQRRKSSFDESRYQRVLIPKDVMYGRPLQDSKGHVDYQHSKGKIHHGRPELCHEKRSSGYGGQYNGPKELPPPQRRNGLAPEVKNIEKQGSQGQSIVCFEDRVRREQNEAMKSDPYGGQKCPHVHPAPAYFTYSCPQNDKRHNHWSAPETTVCRYPNTCMASCFEHPVLNDWVYRQPNNRFYLQRRDYIPF